MDGMTWVEQDPKHLALLISRSYKKTGENIYGKFDN